MISPSRAEDEINEMKEKVHPSALFTTGCGFGISWAKYLQNIETFVRYESYMEDGIFTSSLYQSGNPLVRRRQEKTNKKKMDLLRQEILASDAFDIEVAPPFILASFGSMF